MPVMDMFGIRPLALAAGRARMRFHCRRFFATSPARGRHGAVAVSGNQPAAEPPVALETGPLGAADLRAIEAIAASLDPAARFEPLDQRDDQRLAALVDELAASVRESPVARLGAALGRIGDLLRASSPAREPLVSGAWVRRRRRPVDWPAACRIVDAELAEAHARAAQVAAFVDALDRLIARHEIVHRRLQRRLAAGRLYLARHSDGDDGRRLARRLRNDGILLASSELEVRNWETVRAAAAEALERYRDLRDLLVPAWRHQVLSALVNGQRDPNAADAAVAHGELMDSWQGTTARPPVGSPPAASGAQRRTKG